MNPTDPDTGADLTSRACFEQLAEVVATPPPGAERATLALSAERSHFIRFNRGAVRQATQVTQGQATLALVRGARRIEGSLPLHGRIDADLGQLRDELARLATLLDEIDDDPYLLLPEEVARSERDETGTLPSPEAVVRAVVRAAPGLDFVGFYAGGPVARAFADSRGSRHWHRVETFHFDWCLYHALDKAVKCRYAGAHWSDDAFALKVAEGAQRLPLLAMPPHPLAPGAYRVYFAPSAMVELVGLLGWSGFSAKARRTGTSSLQPLAHHDVRLHPTVQIAEDVGQGFAPGFTLDGFARPPRVPLVEHGLAADTLNSPRSAREFSLPANGANTMESPDSLRLEPGSVPEADSLAALDDGLYVSNLWYLNYADRSACRMTGMTRFACFRVAAGRLVEPLPVMRFDDSFLRMFGEGLIGLTDVAHRFPDGGTWRERQLGSVTTPGALVEGWRLAL